MSDVPGASPQGAPNGAAMPASGAPAELSEQEFMGLLDQQPERPKRQQPAAREPDPEPQVHGEAPDDAGPPKTDPASEEADQLDPDPGEEPAETDHQIDPPSSWTSDERALWQQLSPEVQQVIARRDSDQHKAFTQKTQEIAEHRKALESTFSEIQSERQSYAENLQKLLFVASPEAQHFAQIDWQQLATTDPASYVQLTAQRDALRGRLGAIQQELGRVQQAHQQDQAQQFAILRQAESQKLVELVPEFGDAEKGKALVGDLRKWLSAEGFTDHEIGQVIDARVINVAVKAMRADRTLEARKAAEAKRTAPAASAVLPPGAPRQRSDSAASQRRQQKLGQLQKSGTEKDAIAYLEELLR